MVGERRAPWIGTSYSSAPTRSLRSLIGSQDCPLILVEASIGLVSAPRGLQERARGLESCLPIVLPLTSHAPFADAMPPLFLRASSTSGNFFGLFAYVVNGAAAAARVASALFPCDNQVHARMLSRLVSPVSPFVFLISPPLICLMLSAFTFFLRQSA